MLDRIHLGNFKASRDVDVRLAPLTILAGLNGSGKSTLLQCLAAMRQSYDGNGQAAGLLLHGPLVELGRGRDVLNEGAADDYVRVSLIEDGTEYMWRSQSEADSDLLSFIDLPAIAPKYITSKNFQFLCADRIVPRVLYSQAPQEARRSGFLGVGGEFTIDFLSKARGQLVPASRHAPTKGIGLSPELLKRTAPTPNLSDQVSGWMQQISPGARVLTQHLIGTDEVLLQYDFARQGSTGSSNAYRPTNVGFGMTYSLPILVACLAAQPGTLLLLENPEAHLHPQGQAALGQLLARCAMDGVQIIVETHSDHLLNGVRLAVKERLLNAESVVLHFFSRSLEEGDVFVQSPAILPNGRLSDWPDGFFDQWDKSIDAILD